MWSDPDNKIHLCGLNFFLIWVIKTRIFILIFLFCPHKMENKKLIYHWITYNLVVRMCQHHCFVPLVHLHNATVALLQLLLADRPAPDCNLSNFGEKIIIKIILWQNGVYNIKRIIKEKLKGKKGYDSGEIFVVERWGCSD